MSKQIWTKTSTFAVPQYLIEILIIVISDRTTKTPQYSNIKNKIDD